MVRRSTLDRSPQSAVHARESELQSAPAPPPGGYDRAPAPRRGAGGRWTVWVLRALVWAVLIIIGVRGVIAIVLNQKTPSPPAASTSAKSGTAAAGTDGSFPSSLAEGYAMQFASVYLNFSQSTASQRAQELAAFLPNGADPQLGWNGAGSLKLQSDQVAGISVRDAQHAVVTLLARVNGQMMELGVPIYASGSGMVVNGQPAWLAAPTRAVSAGAGRRQSRHGRAECAAGPAAGLLPGLCEWRLGHPDPVPGARGHHHRPRRRGDLLVHRVAVRTAGRRHPADHRQRRLADPRTQRGHPGSAAHDLRHDGRQPELELVREEHPRSRPARGTAVMTSNQSDAVVHPPDAGIP